MAYIYNLIKLGSQLPWTIFIILQLFQLTCCYRILLAPSPLATDIDSLSNIGRGLIEKGHDVYLVTHPRIPEREQKHAGVQFIRYDVPENASFVRGMVLLQKLASMKNRDKVFTEVLHQVKQFAAYMLEDKALLERLKSLKFDLAIVDTRRIVIVDEPAILVHRLSIPYVTFSSALDRNFFSIPMFPSLAPHAATHHTLPMTFLQRLETTFRYIKDYSLMRFGKFAERCKELAPEQRAISALHFVRSAKLHLVDVDPLLDHPLPVLPTTIYVGGHMVRKPRPLSSEFRKICSGSENGIILVAFGAYINTMDPSFYHELRSGLKDIGYTVLLRHARELLQLPDNFIVKEYIPQHDLLSAKNCVKLFINHCGVGSQFESLVNGIPMLCIPLAASSPFAQLLNNNFGEVIMPEEVTGKKIRFAVQRLLKSSYISQAVQKYAQEFAAQPMHPRDRAVFWLEYVLKFGSSSLHSPLEFISWVEYYNLDVLFAICLVVAVFLYMKMCGAVWLYKKCCYNTKVQSEKLKKR